MIIHAEIFFLYNFGKSFAYFARNRTPEEALTSHLGQQKFTWCLFKYMRMGKHPEPIEIPTFVFFEPPNTQWAKAFPLSNNKKWFLFWYRISLYLVPFYFKNCLHISSLFIGNGIIISTDLKTRDDIGYMIHNTWYII